MTEYLQREIDRLDNQLAAIYRRGKLTATEIITTKGLWAQIERLETTSVQIDAREGRRK